MKKYATEERERTEKLLMTMAEKIRRMESKYDMGKEDPEEEEQVDDKASEDSAEE